MVASRTLIFARCAFGARGMQRFSPGCRRPWRHEQGGGSRPTGQLPFTRALGRASCLQCCRWRRQRREAEAEAAAEEELHLSSIELIVPPPPRVPRGTWLARDEPPTAPSTCSPFTAGTRTSADTSSRCTSPSHHQLSPPPPPPLPPPLHLSLRLSHGCHCHHRHHRRHRRRRRRHPRHSPRRPQSSRLLTRVLLRVSTLSLTVP